MDSSPFVFFREAARQHSDIFPAIGERIAWLEFRAIFSGLINGPIWNAAPTTVQQWEESNVPRDRLAPLAQWLALEDQVDFAALPAQVSMQTAFTLLEHCHNAIRRSLKDSIDRCTARSVNSSRQFPAALPISFPRQDAVKTLFTTLRNAPSAINATLIHGSLADGLVADGFSDADVLCFIGQPIEGREVFWRAAQWLFRLNHQLFAINPCMHHGPMIAFADEVLCAAEASLPSAIISNGYWCHGRINEISYHDGIYENIAALEIFESYFERHHLYIPDLHHAFDVLWWTSSALILPVLFSQAELGISVYKRVCLSSDWPDKLITWRDTLDKVSAVRLALGRLIASRLPSDLCLAIEENPGGILAEHRIKLALTPIEIRSLGLQDSHMCAVRHLWNFIRTQALCSGFSRLGTPNPVPIVWQWSRPTFRQPRRLTNADYEHAREAFLARCMSEPAVKAVFEFGEVGCPGLSDLDFCVILDDEWHGTVAALQVGSLPEDLAYVMDHDPLFVSATMADQLSAFFPIFAIRQIHGAPLSLPLSDSLSPWMRAAAATHLNLRKYPGDLDWLVRQPALNVRTILAFLHSARHIATCLQFMQVPIGKAIHAAITLDQEIRDNFQNGAPITKYDISEAINCCMQYSEQLCETLTQYWLQIALPRARQQDLELPHGPAATAWVRGLLSLTAERKADFHGITLAPEIATYLSSKMLFTEFERARQREASVYIEDPSATYLLPDNV